MPWSPYDTPAPPQTTPAKSSAKGGPFLLGVAILALVGYLAWGQFNQTPPPFDGGDDSVVVDPTDPDDKTPPPAPVDSRGTVIVVVSESKARPVDQVSALNQYDFWRTYLPSMGMKWYLLDPDDKDAKTFIDYAGTQNVAPPFILQANGPTPLWLAKFPPGGYDVAAPSLSPYKAKIEGK